MTARVGPGSRRELGAGAFVLSRVAGRVTRTEPPAIFTTLGRTRRTFWGWLAFAATLMPFGALPRRESELVILRVAHRRGSAYEWAHHERLGRRAGLSGHEIELVREGSDDASWSERDRVLLRTADALLARRDLDDEEWSRLRGLLSEREAVELLLLVGHYDMLATTLGTLRVEPDAARRPG